jgi:integrase
VSVHANHGVRKVCGCPWRNWSKCPHAWHFSYAWRGRHYRFSLSRYFAREVIGRTEARAAADKIRTAIRDGTFSMDTAPAAGSPPVAGAGGGLTFEAYGEAFMKGYSKDRGKASWEDDRYLVRRVMDFEVAGRRLGDRLLAELAEHDLEEFIRHLIAERRAVSTRNHYVQLLKAMSRWAVRKGYRERPFVTLESDVIRRRKEPSRRRRLHPGEEERLIAAASAHMQRLIIAALETCCREGELLSLQWCDVSLDRGEITLRAAKTKDREDRVIPISQRLRGVLQMVRFDPAGEPMPPTAHPFGDEIGRRWGDTKRAWQTTVLRATGHKPVWIWRRKGLPNEKGTTKLSPESQAAYRAVNLHFHDLRHEAGSRLLEAGWPVHHVQHMLGHASLQQTSTYLNLTTQGLHESMRKLEEARAACKIVASEDSRAPRPAGKQAPADHGNLLM